MEHFPPERWFDTINGESHLFSTHTRIVERGWSFDRHIHHNLIELNVVLEGHQHASVGSAQYKQRQGDLLIIAPKQIHSYESLEADRTRFFVTHIQVPDDDFLQLLAAENEEHYTSRHPLNKRLMPIIHQLIDALYSQSFSKITIMLKLYQILDSIQQYLKSNVDGKLHAEQDHLAYQIAKHIEALVIMSQQDEQLLHADWSELIAQQLNMSRRHCHRLFKSVYDMSLRDYFMILKQQEAKRLLLTTEDSIEEIAHRIGYENVQSFSRQFTRWANCTPRDYRKLHKDEAFHLTPLQ